MVIALLFILILFWIYLTFVALTFEELMENQKTTVSEICQQFKNMQHADKKYVSYTKLFQSLFRNKRFGT